LREATRDAVVEKRELKYPDMADAGLVCSRIRRSELLVLVEKYSNNWSLQILFLTRQNGVVRSVQFGDV
jgi:hypothetical protein